MLRLTENSAERADSTGLADAVFLGTEYRRVMGRERRRAGAHLAAVPGGCFGRVDDRQREARAYEYAVPCGPVPIRGPLGTGKSFLLGCGVLPVSVTRGERVLVLYNSNAASTLRGRLR